MGNVFYAQIDKDNICCGVSQLSGVVDSQDMIQLTSYDISVLGKMWTGSEWVNNPNETPERSYKQQTTSETNQAVLAEILLNQAKIMELLEGGV